MTDIHIRFIDEEIKVRLAREAKEHGLSLNKYICNILTDYAYNPESKSLEEKYANLARDMVSLYKETLDRTSEALKENTYVIEQLLSREGEQSW